MRQAGGNDEIFHIAAVDRPLAADIDQKGAALRNRIQRGAALWALNLFGAGLPRLGRRQHRQHPVLLGVGQRQQASVIDSAAGGRNLQCVGSLALRGLQQAAVHAQPVQPQHQHGAHRQHPAKKPDPPPARLVCLIHLGSSPTNNFKISMGRSFPFYPSAGRQLFLQKNKGSFSALPFSFLQKCARINAVLGLLMRESFRKEGFF